MGASGKKMNQAVLPHKIEEKHSEMKLARDG
jgi:hypothetical protein